MLKTFDLNRKPHSTLWSPQVSWTDFRWTTVMSAKYCLAKLWPLNRPNGHLFVSIWPTGEHH